MASVADRAVAPSPSPLRVSRKVSFDVFDSAPSPSGSVSGGFGARRSSPLKSGKGSPLRRTPKAAAANGAGLISAYRKDDENYGENDGEHDGEHDDEHDDAVLGVLGGPANDQGDASAVDRAKARLRSWKLMADRLESVMVREEQSRVMRASRQSSPATVKTIGQLRKEIHAMKALTTKGMPSSRPPAPASTPPAVSTHHLQQVALLESKALRYEAKLHKRDDAIDQLKSTVSRLQATVMEKQEALRRAKEDVQASARLADESAVELSALKASSERSLGKMRGLQCEVASLRAQLEDADVSLKKQEQLTGLEKSRRLELEQRLVDTDDAISRLKTKVESSKRRMSASHDALEMENRGLRNEVVALQEACLEAKRLATEHAEAAVEVARQRDALEREGAERKLEVKALRAELHVERQKSRVAEEAAAAAASELYVLRATEKLDVAEATSAEALRMEFAATKKVLETMTSNAKVAKAEVSALKEELRKTRVMHDEEVESLKRRHEEALQVERKENMDALREIEASNEAQIRQDVDRIEQARATLARELEGMGVVLQGKEAAIDGLKRMVREREASMAEMKESMESMKVELMQTQDEVEALLTARLKDEMDRAGGQGGGKANGSGKGDGKGDGRDKVRRSPIKRLIAKLSPTKRKKEDAARSVAEARTGAAVHQIQF